MNNQNVMTNSMFDEVIFKLFNTYWIGPQRNDLELAKKQLYKNLTNQTNGYWSGHTTYHIMITGGFLVDGEKGSKKKLTSFGKIFVESMKDK